MIEPPETTPLSDFTRNAAAAIRGLEETGQPEVLTVDGKPAVVVQDVKTYQRLLDALDRAEAIEGIRRGLESAARGEGRPVEEAFAELRAKYDLPGE
ncbi:MAG: type II toxin-antitoxin system Phd/YefM family antitoxin [Chloroflexota bacterium]|nr:type II toxin-antitoxin system Phd/YefM family antitoxin [Chloroflexota bacterium]